jgi:hypothetical protein
VTVTVRPLGFRPKTFFQKYWGAPGSSAHVAEHLRPGERSGVDSLRDLRHGSAARATPLPSVRTAAAAMAAIDNPTHVRIRGVSRPHVTLCNSYCESECDVSLIL